MNFATYLLALSIEPEARALPQTEHQRVEERRADLVVEPREKGERRLHLAHRNPKQQFCALWPLDKTKDFYLRSK
uniref:Uncharacterized protein n=1 Tax=Candidatus Kentrum sp. DK TaxID=2126562 RepID=A0A450STY3_9GAMM|nr:MAG: hypothetical protein BECKDK2373B_GA0170837_106512 [Candidatus Kentron sp. DK]